MSKEHENSLTVTRESIEKIEPLISDEDEIGITSILIQTLIFTIVLVAIVFFAGAYIREPLTQFAEFIVDKLGWAGVFVGILLTDTLTFPVPPDTYLLMSVATDRDPVTMLIVCSIGSILAGNLAYTLGPHLAKIPFFKHRIEGFRGRGEKLFERYGVWAVVIAALTPIPFSIVCWFSAIYKMNRWKFFLATFARIPRLIGYYWLFVLGWA